MVSIDRVVRWGRSVWYTSGLLIVLVPFLLTSLSEPLIAQDHGVRDKNVTAETTTVDSVPPDLARAW